MTIELLPIDGIIIDPLIQTRVDLNDDSIAEYTFAYSSGVDMPKPVVFREGDQDRLSAGFQRLLAAKNAKLKKLECEIRIGGLVDAIMYSAASNIGHGRPLSVADKRRTVEAVLGCHWEWPDKQIAEHCGFSTTFVREVRQAAKIESQEADEVLAGGEPAAKDEPEPAAKAEPKKKRSVGRPSTADKKAAKIGQLLRDNPRAKDKDIADKVRSKTSIVKAVRKKLEDGGIIAKPEPVPKQTKKSDELLDSLGQPVPPLLRDLFGDPYLLEKAEIAAECKDKIKSLRESINRKGDAWNWLLTVEIMKHLSAAAREIESAEAQYRAAVPHAVCECKGVQSKDNKQCQKCAGSGWYPKWRHAELERIPKK